ncbi:hypothetical protein AVEN_171006-1 [Araneus ventricosus]|uniref:Uncharacterized protein n=1 Tax=Araneus ventricosus TaxID=182803 RepID=A0A4Y2TDP9_ARAVE|nr:hypothetical protein AVEN_171006-1 [Araneus ventricosus]
MSTFAVLCRGTLDISFLLASPMSRYTRHQFFTGKSYVDLCSPMSRYTPHQFLLASPMSTSAVLCRGTIDIRFLLASPMSKWTRYFLFNLFLILMKGLVMSNGKQAIQQGMPKSLGKWPICGAL